jgi:hypothetical protein
MDPRARLRRQHLRPSDRCVGHVAKRVRRSDGAHPVVAGAKQVRTLAGVDDDLPLEDVQAVLEAVDMPGDAAAGGQLDDREAGVHRAGRAFVDDRPPA